MALSLYGQSDLRSTRGEGSSKDRYPTEVARAKGSASPPTFASRDGGRFDSGTALMGRSLRTKSLHGGRRSGRPRTVRQGQSPNRQSAGSVRLPSRALARGRHPISEAIWSTAFASTSPVQRNNPLTNLVMAARRIRTLATPLPTFGNGAELRVRTSAKFQNYEVLRLP